MVLAALHVLAGLAGVSVALWTSLPLATANPIWIFPVQMLVFSAGAAVLVAGSRGDARVLSLAVVFLLIATSFARVPTIFLESHVASPGPIALLRGLRVDAFLPLFAWLFFRDFPRGLATPHARLLARLAIGVAALGGCLILAANLALSVSGAHAPALAILDADDPRSPYWAFVYGLTALALPFAAWKARTAPEDERRRAALFAAGLIGAALIYSAFVFAIVSSERFLAWFEGPGGPILVPFLQLVILSIPITTAYAVLVDQALPVRVILRQAMQYALARGVVTAGAALPFVWLALYLWPLRGEPLSSVLGGTRSVVVLGAGGLGVVAVRMRRRARNAIDRTFFREEYDARRILLGVAERSRQVKRAADLAELLAGEIDRALHLEGVAVLVADPLAGELRSSHGSVRPLALDSSLAGRLAEASEPVDATLEGLPEDDRYWLADAAAQLLVPLVSSGDELIGLLALGGKRSELPFSGEDRQLLAAIGAAGAVTLESRLKLGTAAGRGADEAAGAGVPTPAASVCSSCQRVSEPVERCSDCGSPVESIPLPAVLNGKFQLQRKVGEGGMGVVYRALDLDLNRSVAIKTLPRTAPEEAARLRREARAMAAVQHPNLAVVYAAETWKGTPLLVTEFLEGGTLEDRIARERLPLDDARELGAQFSAGLARVHRAGILHRDVKPSNIGFTDDGIPKLLDFGLARVVGDGGTRVPVRAADLPSEVSAGATLTDHGIVGTPLYMSPEAIRGDAPDASFDLWALAAVLYEAISGRNPVERPSWVETLRAIQDADVADVRSYVPDAPAPVAEFFEHALHPDRRRRPASAEEFRERWERATEAA